MSESESGSVTAAFFTFGCGRRADEGSDTGGSSAGLSSDIKVDAGVSGLPSRLIRAGSGSGSWKAGCIVSVGWADRSGDGCASVAKGGFAAASDTKAGSITLAAAWLNSSSRRAIATRSACAWLTFNIVATRLI